MDATGLGWVKRKDDLLVGHQMSDCVRRVVEISFFTWENTRAILRHDRLVFPVMVLVSCPMRPVRLYIFRVVQRVMRVQVILW